MSSRKWHNCPTFRLMTKPPCATMSSGNLHAEGTTMAAQTFGERLRELRESEGWTQAALAERAGLNRFAVAKLEQGLREPTWGTVQKLARAFGVDCTAFVIDRGEGV